MTTTVNRRLIALAACAATTLALSACVMPAPNPEPAPPTTTTTTVPGAMYDDETGARVWTARLDKITGPRLICMEVKGRPDALACVTAATEGVTT